MQFCYTKEKVQPKRLGNTGVASYGFPIRRDFSGAHSGDDA